jgi:hypothetical protein
MPRALRRALALSGAGILSAVLALACSQSKDHPPVSGDCADDLCPPAQPRYVSGGAEDGGEAGREGGALDARVQDAIGPDDGGNFPDVNVFPDVAID